MTVKYSGPKTERQMLRMTALIYGSINGTLTSDESYELRKSYLEFNEKEYNLAFEQVKASERTQGVCHE